MTYTPLLPRYLDFPEILGLRAPLPAMVLNDIDDDLYDVRCFHLTLNTGVIKILLYHELSDGNIRQHSKR
ncbi:hypothetical protein ES705_30283 [subsurface metagenome]